MRPSPDFPYAPRYAEVLGSRLHYVTAGEGKPILFLHGNPTSSYMWRNVLPHLSSDARVIAVDLVGMGKSDKPALAYRFFDHLRYVEGFVEALDLTDVTLVLHDWGGGLGLSFARRHPERVRAVAFFEAVLRPIEWREAPLPMRLVFRRMRDPQRGDRMNLDNAFFLKRLLPLLVRRRLSATEKAAYLAPYPTRESRRPVAQWPREIPISGEPADTHREISANYEWLRTAELPKLLLHATPGAIINRAVVARLEREVTRLESVPVGKGRHYLTEDVPDAIGQALQTWWRRTVLD